jgi:ABC-type proline/glycine betaine transport system permease subunit
MDAKRHIHYCVAPFWSSRNGNKKTRDQNAGWAPAQVFVLMHSVMWPLALSTYAGFRRVPETLRMTGRNYGLGPVRMVLQILVPAALPCPPAARPRGS